MSSKKKGLALAFFCLAMKKNYFKNLKTVSQEHPLGCAVACVASLSNTSYKQALNLFDDPELAWNRGFYCSEIVKALAQLEMNYTFEEYKTAKHSKKINKPGSIVFIEPNSKYPAGHFMLRLENGWMNPWANFPQMIPVESKVEKKLPGDISYIVYEVN